PLFRERNNLVLLPVAERSEPEVPVEPRLIRRVDAWTLVERLRLVAERVGGPVLTIVGALELDLVATAGHHGEEAILISDAKRFQHRDRRCWQRQPGNDNVEQLEGGVVCDDCEQKRADGELERVKGPHSAVLGFSAVFGFRHRRLIVRLWEQEFVAVPQRNPACKLSVVEQENAKAEDDVIEERVVAGEDDGNLPHGHDKEQHHADSAASRPLARKEE